MAKKITWWLITIIFYGIYSLLFDYIIGKRLPVSLVGNLFALFVLIFINIPLSAVSTAKVFSIIGKSN